LHKSKTVWDSTYDGSSVITKDIYIAQKTYNSHDIKPFQEAHLVAIADNYIDHAADQLKE
jgi:hypothetical protein